MTKYLNMGKSQALYEIAKKIIPGGTQLFSKRPELFLPKFWPAYYSKAKGCKVWDLDGREYIDMSYMGMGSCILGYADTEVNNAVMAVIKKGNMSTLNAPEEVKLANLLCQLHPWANMVRYARTGGEAMAIAVRIARAASGKDGVLFCGYHGWHDWYLAANLTSKRYLDGHLLPGLNPLGVPRALKGSAYPFNYNDAEGFLGLINRHKKKAGVIVIEAIRNNYPEKKFIQAIERACRKLGIILIVDEVSSGWRLNLGGAHLILGIKPDIAVFAKGMSNGFPMAAIIGKEKVMQVAQDTFISSTYWTDRIGPAAALATINKLKDRDVIVYLSKIGRTIQEKWKLIAEKNSIAIQVDGIYPLSHFIFKHPKQLILKTLFTQLMLEKGFLATTSFYSSYAHKNEHLERYLVAVDEAFRFISKSLKRGDPEKSLKGEVCHSGFKRLT